MESNNEMIALVKGAEYHVTELSYERVSYGAFGRLAGGMGMDILAAAGLGMGHFHVHSALIHHHPKPQQSGAGSSRAEVEGASRLSCSLPGSGRPTDGHTS